LPPLRSPSAETEQAHEIAPGPSPDDLEMEPAGSADAGQDLDDGVGARGRPTRIREEVSCGVRAVGLVLVCFVLYALFGTALYEGHVQRHLLAAGGLRLSSPDIGLDSAVVQGDSRSALLRGPGLVPGSAQPGENGPLVIAGHRTAAGGPFRHLTALHPGDQIVLRTRAGQTFTYAVERSVTTSPRAVIQQEPGPQALLLITATPAYQGRDRLVVEARLVAATNQVQSVGGAPYRLPDLSGSVANGFVAGALIALLGVGWAVRSRYKSKLRKRMLVLLWLPALVVSAVSCALLLGATSRVL
jgi:LPXTG-site transpeptidase (sortase) family protein